MWLIILKIWFLFAIAIGRDPAALAEAPRAVIEDRILPVSE